jgi:hypothetical protein
MNNPIIKIHVIFSFIILAALAFSIFRTIRKKKQGGGKPSAADKAAMLTNQISYLIVIVTGFIAASDVSGFFKTKQGILHVILGFLPFITMIIFQSIKKIKKKAKPGRPLPMLIINFVLFTLTIINGFLISAQF